MGLTKLIDLDLLDRFLGKLKELIPTKTSDLTNDSGFITGYTETDPTVPSWAKASSKPTYTANEIGLGNVANVLQYSASNPPPYPVTSVNGSTGAVTIPSELPSVSASDNNKVLTVVNGSWEAANASGSGSSILTFNNISVPASAWVDTEEDVNQFRAAIPLTGVTSSHMPFVAFSSELINEHILSPIAETYAGGVYIYADELMSSAITIPTITCLKGG